MAVFVLDRRKKPLMPCSEKRARLLLQRERARVHRLHPFTIRLVDRTQEDSEVQPVRLKLDPGSRHTGVALTREDDAQGEAQVLHLAEINHRTDIHAKMVSRSSYRRTRRGRNARYRQPRFNNRTRSEGWLPPSLRSRVEQTQSWVARYCRLAPVAALSVETVRFDMQLLENPDIEGEEYQQGTLYGTELWHYLLAKWNHQCAYCEAENVPLTKDHVVPRTKNGSNRVSNLVPACVPCNQAKDNLDLEDFLADQPERLARIFRQLKAPLRDAAAVNTTCNAVLRVLEETGLPVEVGTGAQTKFNRKLRRLPKSHALDALCVGESTPAKLCGTHAPVLQITAKGRGSYQRHLRQPTKKTRRRTHRPRTKLICGFQTGDLVRAVVRQGKYAGIYTAEVRPRSSGSGDLFVNRQKVAQGINLKYCNVLSRVDGYTYHIQPQEAAIPSTPEDVDCLAETL